MTNSTALEEALRGCSGAHDGVHDGAHDGARTVRWVDVESALRQLSGDEATYVEICEIFLHESQQWSMRLPRLAQQDREGFVSLLHEVTNAMPIVGASVAGKVLRAMEWRLRDDDQAAIDPALADVMRGIQQVCAELREYIARSRPQAGPA